MKSLMISTLAAAAMSLGACAHMDDAAALSPDQIRAELASISQELAKVSEISREDSRRMTVQNKASAMALGVTGRAAGSDLYARSFEGPVAVMPIGTARPRSKRERLIERQGQLRAALATASQPKS